LQSKRAKIQVDLVTPPSVESDGRGAQDQIIDPENGRLTCTIPKVVHGSAVELGHVPLRSNRMRKRKNFIWTVRDHVDCLLINYQPSWLGTPRRTETRKHHIPSGAEEAKPPQGEPTHSTRVVPSHSFFLDGGWRYVLIRQGDRASS
jgi:hypothetical protein